MGKFMDSKTAISQLKKLQKLVKNKENRLAAEGWDQEWKCLIAIVLSAQSRDTKTIQVCEKLFKKYPTPKKLGNARLSSIEKEIREINYHKTKSRNIKETSKMIEKFGLSYDLEELMKFPGVGRKTANVFLVEARKENRIGVDTHVGRISRKLKWTKNTDPNKVEKDLMKIFPKRYWNSINYILVNFGQIFGKSRKKEDELLKELFS